MFNFQASIQASSQQRALHPGPGCRTFITILGIVMSWSVAQVSAGWAAIPNAFHPLSVKPIHVTCKLTCLWFKRAFTLVSEKRWHHNCHRLWWHCACRFLRSLFLHFVMCLFGVRCCSTSFSLWSWDVATFALNPHWSTEHGVHACVSWGEPSHYTSFHITCSSVRPTPSALQLFRNT